MADAPYTQHKHAQYRGPFKSEEYNDIIERNYRDITTVYNKANVLYSDQSERFAQDAKNLINISKKLEELQDRLSSLEDDTASIVFSEEGQLENDRFDSTEFAVVAASQCSYDSLYGILTLPTVPTSSTSKLSFTNQDNTIVIPPTLETRVQGATGTADTAGATIDTSEPELAIARSTGRIWERNVIVDSPDAQGAEMTLYLSAPVDLFTTVNSNQIILHPYPFYGSDIVEIAYTTNVNNMNDDQDGYTVLNTNGAYDGESRAIGNLPPGGWSGDVDLNAGPRSYHFNPLPITGLRIKLRQRHYYREGSKYVYSYGLQNLDLRQTKFMQTGKALIRFDAPDGETISNITNVIPEIWNVEEWEVPLVFSYRTIWETSFNSGVYTTDTVPVSNRVWIEVTLTERSGKGTPALSSLSVEYD